VRRSIVLLGGVLLWVGCSTEAPPPPALPEEPVILEDWHAPGLTAALDEAALVELDSPGCDYSRARKLARERQRQPRLTATPAPAAPRVKVPTPTQVIAQGLKEAEVEPTPECYVGKGAICHFPFEAGKIYTIRTHPSVATRLYFPRGDRVVTQPLLKRAQEASAEQGDPKAEGGWEQISGRVGPEGAEQDVFAFRPVTETTPAVVTGVDLESGRSIFFRLVVAKTPMLGVTWDIKSTTPLYEAEDRTPMIRPALYREEPPKRCPGQEMRMPIELAQLHTAYRIDTKGPVGFLPTQVFDDGKKSIIKLKPIPGNMPTVFVYKPDGTRGLVYFTPYRVPNDPSHGVYYIIDQVWPKIELVGTDGQSVMITRITDVPAIAHRVQ
jgi:hypothetical protein